MYYSGRVGNDESDMTNKYTHTHARARARER